ncbi:Outer membrane protein TolC [Malonomonas rubra DSM 5091]|uniref:Outer membrane protein TolC n=1 Tax=Malonomonas rubra DSM 5091 TaxID=1122189 RepID=A0A1M6BS69_MALRU|nr:TolC family protein [Malonomonas rubra]SHI51546.1 Outer membrane protein TolC [Malonomonas rubra DSM 5091]
MQRTFFKALLLITVLAGMSSAALGAITPQLQQLLAEADNNPALTKRFAEIDVYQNKVVQAGALSDPVMSLSVLNFPIEDGSDDDHRVFYELRISQMFPFWGKLDARAKAAARKAQWYSGAFEDVRLQVRGQVKDAWFRLLFQQQAIELTKRNLKLIDDFIRLTETRYEVGTGLQQNVLKAHLQRSKQLDKLLEFEQLKEATSAELNSLAGRASHQSLEPDGRLVKSNLDLSLVELQQNVDSRRPMFTAYEALIEAFETNRTLAKLDDWPDFTLFAAYRYEPEEDDAGVVGISFNLPVRRERRAAAKAEADSALRQVIQERNDFGIKVDLAIHRALTRYQQSGKLAELYQSGIIPQADQTFQATLSAYQVDKVDFLDLLDSLMTLYSYQIDHIKAISDQQRSLAAIEAAAGLEIDLLPVYLNSEEG